MADKYPDSIDLTIKTRLRTVFEGKVRHVISKNIGGEFAIMPMHTNFITLINGFVRINQDLPDTREFKIDNGMLIVLNNRVDIYLGI